MQVFSYSSLELVKCPMNQNIAVSCTLSVYVVFSIFTSKLGVDEVLHSRGRVKHAGVPVK